MASEAHVIVTFKDNTVQHTQNIVETRLAKLYYFEAAEFENDKDFQLSSSFRVTVMAWNFTFFFN